MNIWAILLALMIGIFIFFRSWDYLIKLRNKKVGKKYCEENGLKFLKVRHYELHTRLYFVKDGIESWANYKTDKDYNITWNKESPKDILMEKQRKK
ncbi:DUF3139 domain-containing protein [Zobellia nedashkovskayae]